MAPRLLFDPPHVTQTQPGEFRTNQGEKENPSMKMKWEQGFTLIELLVVVAIIGILAAIAIPQYAAYKKQSVDAKMKSDLHNAATAAEAYYGSNGNSYSAVSVGGLITYGYRQSEGLTMAVDGDDDSFTLTASHLGGNAPSFHFDSNEGKILPD
jgi:type IV pilus assembly protein PilA